MGTWVLKLAKKIPLHPSFILLFLWFLFSKNIYSFVLFISVVLSHEYGHYYVAKKLGYKLDAFFLAPYGACLNYKEKVFEYKDEIKIAVAGPLVNIALSLIAVAFWWIFPEIFNYTKEFVSQSFVLALFNLLPCYPLDGGRVFVGIVSKFKPRKWAIRLTQIFNVLVSTLLLVCFIFTCFYDFNPTLCLCGCFLLFGIIESKTESKYQPAFIYKKKTKNFSKPFFMCISGDTSLTEALKHVEINRFTIFVVLLDNDLTKLVDEQRLKDLLLKYPVNSTFNQLFIKQEKE